jgi:PAS domain S-box-containing protein
MLLEVQAAERHVEHKRVLILQSFGHEYAPYNVFSAIFRAELKRQADMVVEVHETSLQARRDGHEANDKPTRDYLQAIYAEHPPDLIVTIGGPSTQFVQRNRERMFAGVPVMAVASRHWFQGMDAAPGIWKAPIEIGLPQHMETILDVLPSTTNVVLVLGHSPHEQQWRAISENELAAFTNRVTVSYMNDLSLAEIEQRVAHLPPGSAVLYGLMIVDAAGVSHENDSALQALRAAANAPVFGLFDYQIGRGIVGGRLISLDVLGREVTDAALQLLRGDQTAAVQTVGPGRPIYDERELRRWKIDKATLPPGSEVRFQQPSPWKLYRVPIIIGALIVSMLASLTVALSVALRRQRRAEVGLQERIEFERQISELSTLFINLPAEQVESEIVAGLGRLSALLGFNVVTLTLVYDADRGDVKYIHESSGLPPIPTGLTEKDFPWVTRQVFAGHDVSIGRMNELPPEAQVDRATFDRLGIRSSHGFPVLECGRVVGALGLNSHGHEKDFSSVFVPSLRLAGEIFINALQRMRTDRQLRESDDRLNLAVTAAGTGFWSLDPATGRFWVTPGTLALFRLPQDTMLDLPRFLEVVHPEDRDLIRETVDQAVRFNRDVSIVYRAVLPGGETRWFESFGRSHSHKGGAARKLAGITIDITNRKQAELESHRLVSAIAHLSRVAMMGELSGALAHELNQPLAAILSNAQAGLRFMAGPNPDLNEIRELLQDIASDDKRAVEVIRGLRALMKNEPPRFEVVDINPLVEKVVQLLHGETVLRSAEIDTDLGINLPRVKADPIQVQQVMLNLLVNALDAVESCDLARRRIVVRTQRSGAGRVRVRVDDRGCGLTEENRSRLFQSFHTTKSKGMGLGLSICQSIMHAHGGRIWAENRADDGVSFQFEILEADAVPT